METNSPIRRTGTGIQRGDKEFESLELHQNGLMEFYTPLDQHFCWKQSDEEFKKNPELYPYPAVEYPATFLRLYRDLIEGAGIRDEILSQLVYINLKGYTMRPFAPTSIGYIIGTKPRVPYPHKDYTGPMVKTVHSFAPDKIAYDDLLVPFYGTFGYEPEAIPFYDREKEVFDFSR